MKGVETRPWTALLVATILLAAVLRLLALQSGLWYDEILTLVVSARLPISRILTEFTGVNAHPLYSVLAHASIAAFGESAWALRLPACLFGIASVVVVYVLAVRMATRAEAWAAAAILATSYHHIWFSQNARGYTMIGFFTLVSTLFLLRACQFGRRIDYIAYGLACAAGIYTHLTMGFIVAGHVVVVLVGRVAGWRPLQQQPLRPMLQTWTATTLFSAIVYAPFAAGVLAMIQSEAPRPVVQVATASWALGEAVRGLVSGAGVPAMLAAAAFAMIGVLSLWRRHSLALALLVAPGIATAVGVLALGEPLRPRFFVFLSGAVVIFVGCGVGVAIRSLVRRLGERIPGEDRPSHPPSASGLETGPYRYESGAIVVCTLAIIAVSVPALLQNYRVPKQDFDGAIRFLDAAESQGARVSASGPACFPLQVYYGKTWGCLESVDDWRAAGGTTSSPRTALVVYTLVEYVPDQELLRNLRTNCPVVRRFAGTLGGGDIIVCDASRQRARR